MLLILRRRLTGCDVYLRMLVCECPHSTLRNGLRRAVHPHAIMLPGQCFLARRRVPILVREFLGTVQRRARGRTEVDGGDNAAGDNDAFDACCCCLAQDVERTFRCALRKDVASVSAIIVDDENEWGGHTSIIPAGSAFPGMGAATWIIAPTPESAEENQHSQKCDKRFQY